MSWPILEFRPEFDRESFECGSASLDEYIRKYVSQDLKRKIARAYVALASGGGRIVGYYTVSSAQVACQEAPAIWKKKVGVYPVPCSRIGRLAVDKSVQGKGLGERLLTYFPQFTDAISRQELDRFL